MKTTETIILKSSNFKSYLPLDIVAFSWAFASAMGESGEVNMVDKSGESYYFNWAYGDLSKEMIYEILPMIAGCDMSVIGERNVPQGWHHIYLGCGNNLIIKEEYVEPLKLAWESFSKTVEKGKYIILYNVWQELVTDIVKNKQSCLEDDCENDKELPSEEIRICPYCGGHKDKLELLCYYSNENIMWSDFRHLLPQVAVPSLIQKCPHCGKHYIIKASHVLIKDTADFEFIDPVCWNYFSQSYDEYSKMEKDDVVDYNHRFRIWGAFNDEFRRVQNPPIPTEQDLKIFKDNMLHLMEYFPDSIDKAEMYREMGLFDECFKQLDLVNDEGDESKLNYKRTIFDFAKQQVVNPFGWQAE